MNPKLICGADFDKYCFCGNYAKMRHAQAILLQFTHDNKDSYLLNFINREHCELTQEYKAMCYLIKFWDNLPIITNPSVGKWPWTEGDFLIYAYNYINDVEPYYIAYKLYKWNRCYSNNSNNWFSSELSWSRAFLNIWKNIRIHYGYKSDNDPRIDMLSKIIPIMYRHFSDINPKHTITDKEYQQIALDRLKFFFDIEISDCDN